MLTKYRDLRRRKEETGKRGKNGGYNQVLSASTNLALVSEMNNDHISIATGPTQYT